MNTKKRNNQALYTFIILGLVFVILFLINQLLQYPFFYRIKDAILNVFFPFLISFIIVYVFHPVLYWFEKKFAIKTWVSTIVLLLLDMIIIITLIEVIFPLLGQQITNLFIELPRYVDQTEILIDKLQTRFQLADDNQILTTIISYKDNIVNNIGKSLVNFTISSIIFSFKSIGFVIMIPIIIFIMMTDYANLHKKVSDFLIKHKRSEWIQLLKNIDHKLGGYIRGQFIIMTYMFFGTYIPLLILGMPNAFIFSLIIAFTNMIPYLGPYLGGIPLCIYAYFQSPHLLIASLIIIFFMQQFDGNLGQPLVYGSQLKIHPLIIIIVMLIGSAFGGIIGLVVSVPIYIVTSEIYLFFKPRIKNQIKLEKNL